MTATGSTAACAWVAVMLTGCGDALAAESNAPPKPGDSKGIKAWVMKLLMQRAGAGVPSANRITLLRDADGEGVAGDAGNAIWRVAPQR